MSAAESSAGGGCAMFALRIVTADYYLAAPLAGLDVCRAGGSEAAAPPGGKVPVVRVFGATPAGQKTCLHLHGIFPYIYVPYDGHGQDPDRYLRLVAFSIDRALNVALGNPSSAVQHVFKISLVSGMPFYGFHEKERQFMKIYLYNPAMVKRVCELLQGGAVMNKCYQPHEAHVPYLLQLFIDYNLYGMNLINLAAVKFRKTRRKDVEVRGSGCRKDDLHEASFTGTFIRWEVDEIPSSLVLEGVEPQSTCELEVDGVAADILNRHEMEAQIGRNPGLQAIWEDEKQRRRDKSESSQISPPDSQDRGYVPATESEKIFQKRIKEILKREDFSVTLSSSFDCSNASDEFSAELTLHSDPLSLEVVPCTPANMVEVHKDHEPSQGNAKKSGSEPADALIDEEAILNIMETSQTFQPLSQRLSQSPVFMNSSQDQALINLLVGLEDDGYQTNGSKRLTQQHFSENCSNLQNSDDEENEPQIAKEEMELSFLMSQRWDSAVEEDSAKRQRHEKQTNGSSTEEEESSSSDDEMEWSGNSLPLTNFSIPQLDGTADESSDSPLNKESSRTHSSVIATSKMSVKTSIFHNDAATFEAQSSAKTAFQCQHTSALSSHVLKKEDLTAKFVQPTFEKGLEFSVHSLTNKSTYSGKYSAPFKSTVHAEKMHIESHKKDSLPVHEQSVYDFSDEMPPPVSRHLNCRKYTSIRKTEKDTSFMHSSRHISDSTLERNVYNFSDFNHSTSKISSEGNEQGNATSVNSFFPSALKESCDFVTSSGVNKNIVCSVEPGSTEGRLNKLKIRCEESQEQNTEATSLSQQAAHYRFFPSVVLSNCLNRPQKLAPVIYKLQQGTKQSRLKLCRKRFTHINQDHERVNDQIDHSSHKELANANDKIDLCGHQEPYGLNDQVDFSLGQEDPTAVNNIDSSSHREPACRIDLNTLQQQTTTLCEKLDPASHHRTARVEEKLDLAFHQKHSVLHKKMVQNSITECPNRKKCLPLSEESNSFSQHNTSENYEEVNPASDQKVTTVNETNFVRGRASNSLCEKVDQVHCREPSSINEKTDVIYCQKHTNVNEQIPYASPRKGTSINEDINHDSHLKPKSVNDKLYLNSPLAVVCVKEETDPASPCQPSSVNENMYPGSRGEHTSVKEETIPENYQLTTSVKVELNSTNRPHPLSSNDASKSSSCPYHASKNVNMDPASHWQHTSVSEKLDLVNHSNFSYVNEKSDLGDWESKIINESMNPAHHLGTKSVTEKALSGSHEKLTKLCEETTLSNYQMTSALNKQTDSTKKPTFVKEKYDPVNQKKSSRVTKKSSPSHKNLIRRYENTGCDRMLPTLAQTLAPAKNQKPSTENRKIISDHQATATDQVLTSSPTSSCEMEPLGYTKPTSEMGKWNSITVQNSATVTEVKDPTNHPKHIGSSAGIHFPSHRKSVSVTEKINVASQETVASFPGKIDPPSHPMSTSVHEGDGSASHQTSTEVSTEIDNGTCPMPPDVNVKDVGNQQFSDVNEEKGAGCQISSASVTEAIHLVTHRKHKFVCEKMDQIISQTLTSAMSEIHTDIPQEQKSITKEVEPVIHQNLTAEMEDINPITTKEEVLHPNPNIKSFSGNLGLDRFQKPINVNAEIKPLKDHDNSIIGNLDKSPPNKIIISRHWGPTGVRNKLTLVTPVHTSDDIDISRNEKPEPKNVKVDLECPQEDKKVNCKLKTVSRKEPTRFNRRLGLVSHRKAKNVKRVACPMENCCSQINRCGSRPPEEDNEQSCYLTQNVSEAVESKLPEVDSFVSPFGDEGLDSELSSGVQGNKYTLRAKRKMNYETEDGEPNMSVQGSKTDVAQPIEDCEKVDSQKTMKRRKNSNKLPPIIIKYIIVNRFKGQKNMLVKIGKIDHCMEQVKLTEDKINMYKKIAPLKDFWPKVPDSLATKFPLNPFVPKKSPRRKAKQKSSKKKPAKPPPAAHKTIKKTFSLRKKRSRAFLNLPSPSYNAETEDCDLDYNDVMSKLGFLSDRGPSPVNLSPPRCWSPTGPHPEDSAAVPKENLCIGNSGVFSNKPTNSSTSCHVNSKTIKSRQKACISPAQGDAKQNKPSEKGGNVNKKPKSKQRRKTKETILKNETPIEAEALSVISAEVQILPKDEDPAVVPLSHPGPQLSVSQPDNNLSVFSTGHLPSTQLPLTSCLRPVTSTDKPLDFPQQPLVPKGLHPPVISCFTSSENNMSKINADRSHSQSVVFKMKEASFVQNTLLDLSKHSIPLMQSAQLTSCALAAKAENPMPLLKRPMFMGRTTDMHGCSSPVNNPLNTANVFQFKPESGQQPGVRGQEKNKCDIYSLENAYSGENHGPIHLPKNCFSMSLKSPVKQSGWEQNQKGDISTTNVSQRVNQNCVQGRTHSTKVLLQPNRCVGPPPVPGDGQTGIDVLKELLYKRQYNSQQNNVTQEPLCKAQLCQSISSPPEHNAAVKQSPTATSRKPRAPRNSKVKEKTPRVLKADHVKPQSTNQSANSVSNGSPVFLSDPDFESCYSIEDSLSPEHTYNFDINTIGQTGFCSLYSGSQFVPADQNLPQKFLSDAIQEPFLGHSEHERSDHDNQKSKEEKPCSSHQTAWVKSCPLSPELFEKSCVDIKEECCQGPWNTTLQPQIVRPGLPVDGFCFRQPEDYLEEQIRRSRKIVNKELPMSLPSAQHASEWIPIGLNYHRKQSSFDVCQTLNTVSTSFSGHLSSPDGEFMDAASDELELYISRRNDGLTPTPDSSPRSISSPSQSKNGCHTPRTAHILKPLMSPPSLEEIMATLLDHDLMETVYQEPFFSNPQDAPERPREIGGRLLTVETRLPNNLPEFEGDFSNDGLRLWKTAFSVMAQNPRPTSPSRNCQSTTLQNCGKESKTADDKKLVIMPCRSAPTRQRTEVWLQAKEEYERSQLQHKCKLEMHANEKHDTELMHVGRPGVLSNELIDSLTHPVATQTNESKIDFKIEEQELSTENTGTTKTPIKCKETLASQTDSEAGEEAKDDSYENWSSPDSPLLPCWQNVVTPESKGNNPCEEDSKEEAITATPLKHFNPVCPKNLETQIEVDAKDIFTTEDRFDEGNVISKSICRHSTPVLQRRHRKSISEALCCTPVSAEPKLKKMKRKRGDGPDRLRKVLLTTQLKNQFAAINCTKKENSQIEGPTLNNSYGFKVTAQNLQEAKALHEVQHLTLISMELHARTRRDLEPDPEFDPICALFYRISCDTVLLNSDKTDFTGAIVIEKDGTSSIQGSRDKAPLLVRSGITGLEVIYAADEKELFQEVVNLVRRYDPDIFLGYEVQMHSWGYLLQRAAALDVDLCQMISRVPDDNKENRFAAEKDEYGADTMSEINVVGRIVLNVWRMMKSEVALTNYTFENVAFHVLHQRFPLFTFRMLSDWFDNRTDLHRWKMVDHYICRVCGILQMLEQLDLIGRTSELARLFGIQFLHVLTRGSQYRVESMMLRIAKPMNYIALTPSVQQRAQMRAPQCIPLVMEPESRFYSNSVVVLDFQSLYPSIVIAYNYCYSTCLGFVENIGKFDEFKFGCSSLRVPPDLLHQIRHDITVSPSGIAFVKASVRKGVLPRMLEDILKTRIMVKQSMKSYKHDKGLTRMLDARQLGLKLIANVTFGYTAANFSGRMPCTEIGDSIIHKARETLERAIKLVNDTKKWGARVVYGDTDSLFVLLKGVTKEQSFKIGQEIADAVTATNPKPVKLKFEKVYLPCVLQTKKRYVGNMYETLDQKDPAFDAKGIETVRRDSCPAVGKILERSVKLLFETRDISQIKLYVQRQCMKLLEGKASMQDLIFAKEYRGSSSYRPGACVPALELTRKMLAYDRRSEPRVGERVPYVIVYGTPGVPLIQLVRRPIELLQDPVLRLNATYYITKQILPPLNRLFSLIGVDVFSWYDELPRVQKACSTARSESDSRKGTISQYFTTLHCPVCDELTQHGICSKCRSQPQHVAVILNQEIRELEHKQDQLVKICKNCTSCHDRQIQCVSLNCPVLFKMSTVTRELSKAPYYRQLLDQF